MAFIKKFRFSCLRQLQLFCTQAAMPNVIRERGERKLNVRKVIMNECNYKYAELFSKHDVTAKEWEDMRKSFLTLQDATSSLVDSMILEACRLSNAVDNGISYYKFLEENNYKPSFVNAAKCLHFYAQKNGPLPLEDREFILQKYKALTEQFPTLNNDTLGAFVVSLCKIDEWQESIEIIKKLDKENTMNVRNAYSALISCLYKHGQIELGYKYLVSCFKISDGPANNVYSTYLEYCLKDLETFNENIEKLFHLWEKYDFKPSSQTVHEFIEGCNKVGWDAKLTCVTNSTCKVCGQSMTGVELSDKEFKYLSETLMKKLILDKGYIVTSPKELHRFLKFIEQNKPFDVIIDGLNILYSTKVPSYNRLNMLIAYFVSKKQKVLVIGRKHMKKYVESKHFQRIANFFYVDNMSQDDPFLMYAAMASGINCKIVSQDFMRQHQFTLKEYDLRGLLKRWQLSHQLMDVEHMLNKERSEIAHNTNYIVQKQNDHWHIPFQDTDLKCVKKIHNTYPTNWACFKMCT